MPVGVLRARVYRIIDVIDARAVILYTQRGFLHCLFGFIGFLRTSNGG